MSKQWGSNTYEYQQFTATVFGGIDRFPAGLAPVPLFVRELDGREYGTLSIYMLGDRVEINGDGGNVPDCEPLRTP